MNIIVQKGALDLLNAEKKDCFDKLDDLFVEKTSQERQEKEAGLSKAEGTLHLCEERCNSTKSLLLSVRNGLESVGAALGISKHSSAESILDVFRRVDGLTKTLLIDRVYEEEKGSEEDIKNAQHCNKKDESTNDDDATITGRRRKCTRMVELDPEDKTKKKCRNSDYDIAVDAYYSNQVKIARRISGGPCYEKGADAGRNREEGVCVQTHREKIKFYSEERLQLEEQQRMKKKTRKAKKKIEED
mmetsp:Transcript_28568/g.42064  ORF Transcript_28568/g.42064 Transcript_28568/m.42064 type:complete len:245 (+) Transcript_28568:262-996(+)